MKRNLVAFGVLSCAGPWLLAGCGGPTAESGSDPAWAAANATMAAAAWVLGKGCNLQGCPYGSFCDKQTGFCVTRTCESGCPRGTMCNEGLNRCQDPPPAAPPSEFLPSDRSPLMQ